MNKGGSSPAGSRPGANFTIQEERKGDLLLLLKVLGEASPALHTQLRRIIQSAPGSVALDLSGYTSANSAFIGLLTLSAHEKKRRGHNVILVKPDDRVMDLVRLTQTEEQFRIVQQL
ncbi:MAG: STAS domain-containing protein [Planctomycetota bacterium]